MKPGEGAAFYNDAPDKTSGLIGWWNFADGTSEDVSGFGNHGVGAGTKKPWASDGVTPNVEGGPSTWLQYDGTTSSVGVPSFSYSGATFSASLWINFAANQVNDGRLVSNSHTDSDNGGFQILLTASTGRQIVFAIGNGTTFVQTTGGVALALGVPHHVLCAFNAGTLTVYVDGVSYSSATGVSTMSAGASTLAFGWAAAYSGDNYAGQIGDVRLFNTALTAADAWDLYASGLQTQPPEGEFPALFVSTGAPTGALATTEARDTAAFSGSTGTSGALVSTEQPDTAAFAGGVVVSGPLIATETPDAASFAGSVGSAVSGTLAATEGTDTAAFAGGVLVSGSLATTEAKDVAAFAGSVVVSGALSATEGQDVAAFAGSVVVSGTLAATEPADTAAFIGTISSGVSGQLAATEIGDTAAFSGGLVVSGVLNSTEVRDVAAISGTVVVSGSLAVTESQDVARFDSIQAASGTLSAVETSDNVVIFASFTKKAESSVPPNARDYGWFNGMSPLGRHRGYK
jgi:hypothetical protein